MDKTNTSTTLLSIHFSVCCYQWKNPKPRK